MRTLAYCVESARAAVGAAAGSEPLTSPPLLAAAFDPRWLEGFDLLYFRLHGWPERPEVWLNDWRQAALYREYVTRARLDGTIVVIGNCYGAEMRGWGETFYDAGARAVIAGPGENVAAARRVVGTDLLFRTLRRGLELGLPLEWALAAAKVRLAATGYRASDRDAIAFGIMPRGDSQ